MTTVDETDRKLLRLLAHDGRMSVTALAQELGVSRVTIQTRMDRLQNSGVIRRFTVETNFRDEGQSIRAISMIELRPHKSEQITRALRRMPAVFELHTTNGKWGLVAQTDTQTLAHFDEVLTAIGRLDGVETVETCLLLTQVI